MPSATVFLLLLCNDREVLGPWVNGKMLNIFTAFVCGILIVLSLVLTASVVFPSLSGNSIIMILVGGGIAGVLTAAGMGVWHVWKGAGQHDIEPDCARVYTAEEVINWRMPALDALKPAQLSATKRTWMGVLRTYLVIVSSAT
ncbi:hypothetical protein [Ferrovum myxofaciens]|uniref:hypothetical protein n=1 Tax=Ferrovum myxofaciens TaxID=416213 RepID=UPI003EBF66B7